MQCFAYFPTLVYREECPQWVNEITSKIAPYFAAEQVGCENLVKQTQSPIYDEQFVDFKNSFLQAAVGVLGEQGYFVDKYDFFVNGMWGQEICPTGGHGFHVHPNTQVCGLYFLETPEKGSYPIFKDPRTLKTGLDLWQQDFSVLSNASQEVHFTDVRPGTFLLFNSWLSHAISTNLSDHNTKFIHFTVAQKEK